VKTSEEGSLTALQLSSFDASDRNNFAELSKLGVELAADKAYKPLLQKRCLTEVFWNFAWNAELLSKLCASWLIKSPVKYLLAGSLACLEPWHF